MDLQCTSRSLHDDTVDKGDLIDMTLPQRKQVLLTVADLEYIYIYRL